MTEAFRLDGKAAARRVKRSLPHSGPVTATRVHEDAWALALILADGDRRRRRILSVREVLVVNRP